MQLSSSASALPGLNVRENRRWNNFIKLPRSRLSMRSNSMVGVPLAGTLSSTRMLKVNLQQRLGNFRLSIDFQVPLDLTVLFGFSGAGKSVTLGSLSGLFLAGNGVLYL